MPKRSEDEYEFEDPYDEIDDADLDDDFEEPDDVDDDTVEDDVASGKGSGAEGDSGTEAEKEPEVEEELPPDHPDTLAALEEIGARVEVDDKGHVWRVFFYEKNTDEHLKQLHGLAALKEIWVIGSRITEKGVESLKEQYPKAKIYA